MILASRGLLDNHIPKEYTNLLTHLKIAGIDLEIEDKFYRMYIEIYSSIKNDKELDKIRKELFKLYYPDSKDSSETLAEELKRRIIEDPNKIMKMGVKGEKLDPSTVNALLNKS
jgi:hypothetical protein